MIEIDIIFCEKELFAHFVTERRHWRRGVLEVCHGAREVK